MPQPTVRAQIHASGTDRERGKDREIRIEGKTER